MWNISSRPCRAALLAGLESAATREDTMPVTTSVRQAEKLVNGWKQARPLLEQWRRELSEVDVQLKQPRVVDPLLPDSASGEPIENGGAVGRFRGEVVYFTDEDAMVRLPSGAMVVLDKNEIAAMSDGKNRFEL